MPPKKNGSKPAEGPEEAALKARERGLERILFFSDVIFAITLIMSALVLGIPSGITVAQLPGELLSLWPRFLSFAINFLVVGSFWISHHNMFEHIRRYDQGLMWFNMLFLLFLAVTPFATSLLGQYFKAHPAQLFYAWLIMLTGLVKLGVWLYAYYRNRLVDRSTNLRTIRIVTLRGLVIPLVFAASLPFTLLNWVLPIIFWLLSPFLGLLIN